MRYHKKFQAPLRFTVWTNFVCGCPPFTRKKTLNPPLSILATWLHDVIIRGTMPKLLGTKLIYMFSTLFEAFVNQICAVAV